MVRRVAIGGVLYLLVVGFFVEYGLWVCVFLILGLGFGWDSELRVSI